MWITKSWVLRRWGEGGAGSVILGNFIQELDDAIAETEINLLQTDDAGNPIPGTETTSTIGGSIIQDVQTTGSILGVDITYPVKDIQVNLLSHL